MILLSSPASKSSIHVAGTGFNPNSEVWPRSHPRRRPRCVGVFCSEKSPIVAQLFFSVILIVKTSGFFEDEDDDEHEDES